MASIDAVSASEPCPAREALAAFQRGILPPADLARLAGHLGRCERCEATLLGMEDDTFVACLRARSRETVVEESECGALEAWARGLAVEIGTPTVSHDGSPAPADEWTGPRAFGAYELLAKLGQGGMGVVYKARQLTLNRIVALKMLPAGCQADPDALARFRVEGEAVARLGHPHVVQIHDFGEHDGRLYFSMEYLEGGTLAERLRGGCLPEREAASLVQALAGAVQAAHEQRIVHRDLKPANVLLTKDGTPRVADFGLAKLLDEVEGSQTQTEAVLGTASYMAPEQAAGRVRQVGPLADVYALGAILYECLTGRPPFKGDDRSHTLELVRTAEPVPPGRWRAGLSRDLEAVCLKCLEKEPGRRYPSARALADDLESWREGRATVARPLRWPARAARSLRRRPGRSLAAAVLLVLVVVAPAAWLRLDPERPRRQIEAALARGERVTLIGETGEPRWFRWATGQQASQTSLSADGAFTVHSWTLGLLELVSEPGRPYRLRARVRHSRSDDVGDVGLYFAYRPHPPARDLHTFVQLTYNDLRSAAAQHARLFRKNGVLAPNAPPAPKGNTVRLYPAVFVPRPGGQDWHQTCRGPDPELFQPAQNDAPPWRTLSVVVTASGVRASWGVPEQAVGELSAAGMVEKLTEARDDLRKDPELAPLADALSPTFEPRGAVGLYVCRGSASFRDVVLEPLDASP
jgi:serine/threonine-protein kinase